MTYLKEGVNSPKIAGIVVNPHTVVLQSRQLRAEDRAAKLSMFGDQVWSLEPAIPDRHTASQAIHWSLYPARFQFDTKLYVFALVNVVDDPPRIPFSRSAIPSIKTIIGDLVYLRSFLRWLERRGVGSIGEVCENDLKTYCAYVQELPGRSPGWKRTAFLAVQRYHAYREHLPESSRLPANRPFGAYTAAQLAGVADPKAFNRTSRINAEVMEPTLSAALIAATTIASDIQGVARRLIDIRSVADYVAPDERRGTVRNGSRWEASRQQFNRLIPAMQANELPIPAIRVNDEIVPDRVGFSKAGWFEKEILYKAEILNRLRISGLEYKVDWLIVKRFSSINGKKWRHEDLDASELLRIVRHVITACFLVIAYLSGVRTGEALNLRRGCISRDYSIGLTFMSGEQLKAAPDRRKRSPATVPWVVTDEVAAAVRVLESLVPGELLFPSGIFGSRGWFDRSSTRARTPGSINTDLREFVAWFNSDVAPSIGHPVIPFDPDGPLRAPRLRRTLAWHIVHKPGGIVAGATQYGHVRTQIMQGYAGLADAGFTNEIDFEQMLLRAEQLHEDAKRLEAGERVSGPAADEYRRRIANRPVFEGTTVSSEAQVKQFERNPAASIHQGAMLTCVYHQETAKCRDLGDDTGPNWAQCKLSCQNIAYTDRDIQSVQEAIADFEEQLQLPLFPEPLRRRLEERCRHLSKVAIDHVNGDFVNKS